MLPGTIRELTKELQNSGENLLGSAHDNPSDIQEAIQVNQG